MGWLRTRFKWFWDNLGNIALVGGWALTFAVPAWAVKAAHLLVQYSPASWVAAGFLGMMVASITWRIAASARARWVKSAYDAKLQAKGGPIDPMGKTFERKRIYLNEFALPSHPQIEGKTFIDCEIIGPANILFQSGNRVDDHRLPMCDAVVLAAGRQFFNGYIFKNCTLRGCSLIRVTLFVSEAEYPQSIGIDWLNWIGFGPAVSEPTLKLIHQDEAQ